MDVVCSLGCIVGIRAWYGVATLIELPKCFQKWHLAFLQEVDEICQVFTVLSTVSIVHSLKLSHAVVSFGGLFTFLC